MITFPATYIYIFKIGNGVGANFRYRKLENKSVYLIHTKHKIVKEE